MLHKLGMKKRNLVHYYPIQPSGSLGFNRLRSLNLELLERRLLLSCDTDFTSGILTITCDSENDALSILIDADGAMLLNEVAITGAPSVNNTDQIVVIGGEGDDQITIDQSIHTLVPDGSGESDIDVTVDAGSGSDVVTLTGVDDRGDKIAIDGTRIDLNADLDGDVSLVAVEELRLFGGGGDDDISLIGWSASETKEIGLLKISVDGGTGDDMIRNGTLDGVTLFGGMGEDTIFGATTAEIIQGSEGNDTIVGRGGQDSVFGGAGDDVIKAGASSLSTSQNRVWVDGQEGNDTILTYNGADTIYGGPGDDVIRARPGKDIVYGGTGNDVLDGGNHDDTLYGEAGNDTIQGKKGADQSYGGNDDDVLINALVDEGNDTLEGGEGTDLFRLKGRGIAEQFEVQWVDEGLVTDETAHLLVIHKNGAGALLETETVRDAEQVHIAGFGGNDVVDLRGVSASDLEDASITELHGYGGGGKDTLYGGSGAEYLFGGGARDILYGGEGDDTLDGGSGPDTLIGEAGDDLLLIYGSDAKLAEGHGGSDQILAGGMHPDTGVNIISAGNHTLNGGEGDDTLVGGAGADTLLGEDGNDVLVGGIESDLLDGGNGSDQLTQSVDADQLLSDVLLTGLGTDTLSSIESAVLKAGDGDNRIDASAFSVGPVTMVGGIGSDTLIGGIGDDVLDGGSDSDVLDGGSGSDQVIQTSNADQLISDTLLTGQGSDTLSNIESAFLTGGGGDNRIDASAFTVGPVTISGKWGDDTLIGGTGDDLLLGGEGGDVLYGGAGNDVLDGGSGSDQVTQSVDSNQMLNDVLLTGEGADTLSSIEAASLTGGESGNVIDASAFTIGPVTIEGDQGSDTLLGGAGEDSVSGGLGDDLISGGPGADLISGGEGDDVFDGGAGNDVLDGGSGSDQVTQSVDSNQTLSDVLLTGEGTDTLSSIEKAFLTGGESGNFLDASAFTAGSVTLVGASGNDTLKGGSGDDSLSGSDGNDFLAGGAGNNVLTDGDGDDVLTVNDLEFIQVAGGNGSDELILDASDLILDLRSVADSDLTGIELIDITGSGDNKLVANYQEVLNLSDTSNQLSVIGDTGDHVDLGDGWKEIASVGTQRRFTQDGITVLVSDVVTMTVSTSEWVYLLSELDGNDGFAMRGINAGDEAGYSVSAAGDVNNDGYADILIGAHAADPGGVSDAGETYLIFGKSESFGEVVDLGSLDGTDGVVFEGIGPDDRSGLSVSTAGDVNGDGYVDILIGAYGAGSYTGETYLVFGKASGFTPSINLGDLDETDGFVFDGIDAGDYSGYSVTTAGDVNGDGYSDILIGAHTADAGGIIGAGETYVVFGKVESFGERFDLSGLDGSNGFILEGSGAHDYSGFSVSTAGDINGDGFADMLIGAFYADPGGNNYSGETYVVFGKASGFASNVQLGSLDGSNGFVLEGIDELDMSGSSISTAGDVNGDGYDDILIGAYGADPGGITGAGETYVVFGKGDSFHATVDLSGLDGTNGFVLQGIDAYDRSGFSVSTAGDVNGDGYSDILIGAYLADPGGVSGEGETYVVFGKESDFHASVLLSSLEDSDGVILEGGEAGDNSGFSVSTAGDVNGDGYADILIGAKNADPGGVMGAGEAYLVYGRDFTGDSTVSGSSGEDSILSIHGTMPGTRVSEISNDRCITSPEIGDGVGYNRGNATDLVASSYKGKANYDDDQ